jgi:hypothetical protein
MLGQLRMMNLPSENIMVTDNLEKPTNLAVIFAFVCCGSKLDSELGEGNVVLSISLQSLHPDAKLRR